MPKVQHQERNHRIQKYLSLVKPIARRFAYQSGCDCEDLIQVGCLGLIKASQRYKQTEENTFHVFAKFHIRGAILHCLRDSASLVRLPRRVEERALLIRDKNEQTLCPSDQLIRQSYKYKTNWRELDEQSITTNSNSWVDIESKEKDNTMKLALQKLARNERIILQLVIVEGLSLRKAGKKLGVSAMTIQRRLKRALGHLRQRLTTDQSA